MDIAAQLTEYRGRLDTAGLGQYAESLCEAALPGIRLVPDGQIDATTVGVSRLGGCPDLPWPTNNGTPLSFIAQLDLVDMAIHDVEGVLPRAGLLSLFYEGAR